MIWAKSICLCLILLDCLHFSSCFKRFASRYRRVNVFVSVYSYALFIGVTLSRFTNCTHSFYCTRIPPSYILFTVFHFIFTRYYLCNYFVVIDSYSTRFLLHWRSLENLSYWTECRISVLCCIDQLTDLKIYEWYEVKS